MTWASTTWGHSGAKREGNGLEFHAAWPVITGHPAVLSVGLLALSRHWSLLLRCDDARSMRAKRRVL